MNTMRLILAIALILVSLAGCSEGEGALPSPLQLDSLRIRIDPETVGQGKLFRILVEVEGNHPDEVTGTFAGEPLHFEDAVGGGYWALAAAPVDAAGESSLSIVPSWAGVTSRPIVQALSISTGEYRMERLTVAPEFGGGYSAELQRRIDSESARAMAVSRNSHNTPRLWAPPITHPRDDRITSGFGHGRTFNGQVQSRHMGTDFAGAVGAPVLAPARAIVALRDSFYLGGNVLYLDHGAGLVTAYLHLSEHLVSQGDTVQAGELIARVGATGRVTGPHLHWIVRYGEITVDGQSLLDLR